MAVPRVLCGLLLLTVSASAATAPQPPPRVRPTPSAPKAAALGVIFVVDGLSWDRLAFYRPWYVGGLKRLLDEGRVETRCFYRHINTETGPGHASLGTGEPPRVHGIVANRWHEKGERSVYCTEQEAAPGKEMITGAGRLRVATLGDRLVEAHPGARVVSVAGKDRAAVFLAGKDRRHTAYWFNQDTGQFQTSAAYDGSDAARALVAELNRTRAGTALPGRFGPAWKPLPVEEPTRDAVPKPTAVPGIRMWDFQIPTNGIGWDHSFTMKSRGYSHGLYTSPLLDVLIADMAVAFIESDALNLGRRDVPDLLAISFSAQDTVSHSYGAESEENLDVLRRLDLELGRVLDALERRVPRARLAIALSADHGFPPIPEAEKLRNPAFRGGRITDGSRALTRFVDRLNRHLAEDLCLAPGSSPLASLEGWILSYNRAALPMTTAVGASCTAGRKVTSADIDRALPVSVKQLYGEEIAAVWLNAQRAAWPTEDEASEYIRNDFDVERSGDAYLIPRRGVMTHWDPGRGAMHGTHFDYDTHVPLLFWGGPFARAESALESTPYDLAPTLAAALGLELRVSGRDRLARLAPAR